MHSTTRNKQKWIRIGLLVLLLSLVTVWLIDNPPGFDAKISAIGYAVCHQIESHTFTIGDKLLPLCARCTGMYLGTLIALLVLCDGKRHAGRPSRAKIVVLAVFFLIFLVDGVNSTLTTFIKVQPLYPPSNLLRLGTGFLMGVILANLILPLWNQTLWQQPDPLPALNTWKQFGLVLLCEVVVGVMVWLDIPALYYPVAVFSTATILVILGMVYSLLWAILLNKENSFATFKGAWTYYLLGILSACLQIGLMDLLRFSLMGSWSGFQL